MDDLLKKGGVKGKVELKLLKFYMYNCKEMVRNRFF
jgi:hypothetical protein